MASIGPKRICTLKVDATLKKKPDRLPWPRSSKEDPKVQLGVDIAAKRMDIVKLVHKFFRIDGVPMDDLIQEVYVAIAHKNGTNSAHDPRKSSFGHYVYMIARNVTIGIVQKKKRYDREVPVFDAYTEDGRALSEVYESKDDGAEEETADKVEEFEEKLRMEGNWDLARYVRAARSGASPDVLKAVLSWDGRQISNKDLRDFRYQASRSVDGTAVTSFSA